MEIRKASLTDLDVLMDIFAYARRFMQATGNGNQWVNGYPARELIADNIAQGNTYVCEEGESVLGTFYFLQGESPEPNYWKIYKGAWLDEAPYGVIHRIASSGKRKGIASYCFDWCFKQCGNIRIDTHRDNKVMQHLLEKSGFVRCGIIYLTNGSERIAFQKNK